MPPAPGGACVLSTHPHTPPVTKTTVSTDLLKSFNVITKLGIKVLRKDLRVLSGLEVFLPVQEPQRDFELLRVLNDGHKLFNFIGSEFTGTLVDVYFGLFADKIGETASQTLDLRHGENYISLSLNVGVENTQNVLELGSLH